MEDLSSDCKVVSLFAYLKLVSDLSCKNHIPSGIHQYSNPTLVCWSMQRFYLIHLTEQGSRFESQ